MKICAIIAEYNPFHLGHVYHLQNTRKHIHPDYTIVVMSGSFTQRGEPAGWDKWTRASWALSGGADLVLELPVCYAAQSAERFAAGAVQLINQLGVCTHLSFGSECTDLNELSKQAKMLTQPEYFANIRQCLPSGMPYAKAAALAAGSDCKQPNTVLAAQYLRWLDSAITPIIIPRQGDYHSTKKSDGLMSATAIRHALSQQEYPKSAVPDFVQLSPPLTLDQFDLPIRTSLYQLGAPGIAKLHDVTEGLENRITDALTKTGSLSRLIEAVKTRRYTYPRIQRILLYSLLGLTKELVHKLDDQHYPVYARVLGMKRSASPLLSFMEQKASIPLITKLSTANLSGSLAQLMAKDVLSTNLASAIAGLPGSQDYTHPMVIH